MDPLVEEQETRVLQQLSLEDPLTSLRYSPLSKQKVVRSPAPMRKKLLPWYLHYLGHAPMPTIIHSLFFFVQTVSLCVKPSCHHILERSPFAIPSVPSHLQFLSSGSLAIHNSRQRSRRQSSKRSYPHHCRCTTSHLSI